MNNKILKYGALFFGSALVLSACNDTLDKEPLDAFQNTPEFWNSESTVEGYANEFYEAFTGYGNGTGSGLFYFQTLSDDQAGGTFANWTYTNVPASDSNWSAAYEEIRRANIMIQGLESSSMDTDARNHWLGVARMMRAWEYFDLVRKYGNVVLVDKPLDVTDTDYLYGARTDRDAVMDFVYEDLLFATQNISESSSKVAWNRGMAYAMMSDICLWEGTFCKYRSANDGPQKAADASRAATYLGYCVAASQQLIDGGDFSINHSSEHDYRAIYNSVDLTGNPEIIFCKAYVQDIFRHSLIDYTCTSTQISGMTKDAFDSYLFIDGKPLASTSENTDDAGVCIDDHINITAQLAVRDRRLNQTVDSVVFYVGNSWDRTAPDGMEMTSSTGYGVRKYDNTTIPVAYRNQGNSNYTDAPVFWLSVVYLNYAEAKAELGTLTDEDLNKTINLLRDRAGLPDATVSSLQTMNDPANNMNVSSLLWEIRRERRCELMFDNWFRYWDLVRWHQLDKLDSNTYENILLGANLTNAPTIQGVALPDTKNGYMDGSHGGTRTFEAKHYLYPIPSGQITLAPALGQNYGW